MQVEKASVDCRKMTTAGCPACDHHKIYESLLYCRAYRRYYGVGL